MKKMERNSSRPRLGEKSSFGETPAIQFQITYALCKHFDAREKKTTSWKHKRKLPTTRRFGSVCFSFNFPKIAKTD